MKKQVSRNQRVLDLRKKGLSYAEIGRILGISRQRVHAIANRTIDAVPTRTIDKKKA